MPILLTALLATHRASIFADWLKRVGSGTKITDRRPDLSAIKREKSCKQAFVLDFLAERGKTSGCKIRNYVKLRPGDERLALFVMSTLLDYLRDTVENEIRTSAIYITICQTNLNMVEEINFRVTRWQFKS